MDKNPNISKAVSIVGGHTAAAKLLGVNSYQNIQQWIAAGQVPACYCVPLEVASGVSRYLLRPSDGYLIWPELSQSEAA